MEEKVSDEDQKAREKAAEDAADAAKNLADRKKSAILVLLFFVSTIIQVGSCICVQVPDHFFFSFFFLFFCSSSARL